MGQRAIGQNTIIPGLELEHDGKSTDRLSPLPLLEIEQGDVGDHSIVAGIARECRFEIGAATGEIVPSAKSCAPKEQFVAVGIAVDSPAYRSHCAIAIRQLVVDAGG